MSSRHSVGAADTGRAASPRGADTSDDRAQTQSPPRGRRRRQARRRREGSSAKTQLGDAMRKLDEAKARARAQREEYGRYLQWKVRMQRKERRQRQREEEEQHRRRETRLLAILQEHRKQRRKEQHRWDEFKQAPATTFGGDRLIPPPPLEQPSLGQQRHDEMMQMKRQQRASAQQASPPATAGRAQGAAAAQGPAAGFQPRRPGGDGPQRGDGQGRHKDGALSAAAAAGLGDKLTLEDLAPFMQRAPDGVADPVSGLSRWAGGRGAAAPGRVPAFDELAATFLSLPPPQQREVALRAEGLAAQAQHAPRRGDCLLYVDAMRASLRHGSDWIQRQQQELLPRVCASSAPPRAVLRRVNVLAAFLTTEQRQTLAGELARDGCIPNGAGFGEDGAATLVDPRALLLWRKDRVEYMQETARLRRQASLARMARDPPADYLIADDLTRYIPAEMLADADIVDPKPHKRKEQEFFLTAVNDSVAAPAVDAAGEPIPPSQPPQNRRPRRPQWSWMPKVPPQLLHYPEELGATKERRQMRERDELADYIESMTQRYPPPHPRVYNRTEYHGKDYRWHRQERHTLIQVPGRTLALTAPPAPKGRL
eukprot:TRINITY_DN10801_c0_g1_i1.p1 TRINITY_DN10801_c0_g1~~TRINITY_DN10801_c0_g1_i1.p1  ORF type:complete len:597 (+),score=142.15 TRINITY_DN10801_c0_g1_i1:74-1864(+)